MAKDFYDILGVSKDASDKDIKKAYRKLARKWHPDINPGNQEAEEKFKEVSMAYECLGDPEKKKLYDEFGEDSLQTGFDPDQARQYRHWGSGRTGGREPFGERFGQYQSYEDVFGDLFGLGGMKSGFTSTPSRRGRDIEHDMTIDLISALKGFSTDLSMQKVKPCTQCGGSGLNTGAGTSTCAKCGGSGRLNVGGGPMTFTSPCPSCQGRGHTAPPCQACSGLGQVQGTEKIRVVIPEGVNEGSRIRVTGKGEPGRNGGPNGDLYLIVHLKPHPTLKRQGDDLSMEVPVTVSEAMAGATITVPTVEGPVNVKVPPKSQSGQTLKLKGKGAFNLKTKKRGNLMLKLSVRVPKTDDLEMLEAVKKLDGLYEEDVRRHIHI